jgi:hypothetical protein
VTLGVKFYSTQAGAIAGIRFYRGAADPRGYTVELFSSSGTLLGFAMDSDTCSVPCWEQINFASPISIAANTTYVAAYYASNGDYADDTGTSGGLTNGASNGPLIAPASSQVGGNGVYTYSRGFPNQTWPSPSSQRSKEGIGDARDATCPLLLSLLPCWRAHPGRSHRRLLCGSEGCESQLGVALPSQNCVGSATHEMPLFTCCYAVDYAGARSRVGRHGSEQSCDHGYMISVPDPL